MYSVNDIFYLDDEYAKRAHFCNQNGLQIVEIEADEKGRRFQIQEMPAPTQEELNQREMQILKQQLINMDYKTSKYVDGEYTTEDWAVITAERKAIRARIRELENLI